MSENGDEILTEAKRETLLPKRRADFARAHDAAYDVRVELVVRTLDEDGDPGTVAVRQEFRFRAPDAASARKGVEEKAATFDAALVDLESDAGDRALDFISNTERAREMMKIAHPRDDGDYHDEDPGKLHR
jgi:hypothetical protein